MNAKQWYQRSTWGATVCKHWHSLITGPSFLSTHLSYTAAAAGNNHHHLLLLRHFPKSFPKEHYALHFDDTHDAALRLHQHLPCPFLADTKFFFRVVGSVNGLVCLSDDHFGYTHTIVLWNPVVRRYLKLPYPRATHNGVGQYMYVLGFGFDSSTNDHKVVRIVYEQGPRGLDLVPPQVEVYSLKRGTWTTVNAAGVKHRMAEESLSQCFLNETIHWVAYKKEENGNGGLRNWVLLFDVKNQVFKTMKVPEELADICTSLLTVAVLRGSLSLIEYCCGDGWGWCCEIWVKSQYTKWKSWSKMYRVGVEGGISKVLDLRENGEVLLATRAGNLVSYNPNSQEVNDLGMYGNKDAFYACTYKESLVLLDKESGAVSYGADQRAIRWSCWDGCIEDNEEEDDALPDGDAEIILFRLKVTRLAKQMFKFFMLCNS